MISGGPLPPYERMGAMMLAGKLRRWLAAIALLSSIVPAPAYADDGPIDDCALVGDIAVLIMRERQHGATMDDLVRIEIRLPRSLGGLVEVTSIESFRFPQYNTETERARAIDDFRLYMQNRFCPPETK